jgi:hypothetical protein
MITKSDVVSFSSRQCVALASISSGSLSNTRLPSSPGIRNARVRSRRNLVLSQDKIGYANISVKVIFVLQVTKSKARSSVAVHRAKNGMLLEPGLCLYRKTRASDSMMLVCNGLESTHKQTHIRHACT